MTGETPVLLCCITTYDVGQPSRLSKRLGKGVTQMFKIKPLRAGIPEFRNSGDITLIFLSETFFPCNPALWHVFQESLLLDFRTTSLNGLFVPSIFSAAIMIETAIYSSSGRRLNVSRLRSSHGV